jgi:hypothetical protein
MYPSLTEKHKKHECVSWNLFAITADMYPSSFNNLTHLDVFFHFSFALVEFLSSWDLTTPLLVFIDIWANTTNLLLPGKLMVYASLVTSIRIEPDRSCFVFVVIPAKPSIPLLISKFENF